MSLAAVILLTISAVTHASWNMLAKRQPTPSAAFFLAANSVGFIALFPFLAWHATILTAFPPKVWVLVVFAGLFMAFYYCCLAGAYRAGDMSLAYPLARSASIVVVTLVTVALGRRDQLSAQCMAGIVLVVIGCFLIPHQSLRALRLKNYRNASCLFALAAAFGTAAYSMVDDEALRHLRFAFGAQLDTASITILYACLESLSASCWLVLFVRARPEEQVRLRETLRTHKRTAFVTGVGIYGTYTLVLISMAFVNNVSYVVAFRQLSIPLGAALGIVLLKEPAHKPRIAGIAIMSLGLALVGTG